MGNAAVAEAVGGIFEYELYINMESRGRKYKEATSSKRKQSRPKNSRGLVSPQLFSTSQESGTPLDYKRLVRVLRRANLAKDRGDLSL